MRSYCTLLGVLPVFLSCLFVNFSASVSEATTSEAETTNKKYTYVDYFKSGVESYLQEKWAPCALYMLKAVDEHRIYKKKMISCRRTCHGTESEGDFISNVTDIENRFFETGLKYTLCLLRCKNAHLQDHAAQYVPEIDEAFDKLLPYDYMQICYYKAGSLDKAISAAYTLLHHNPGHENMQHNMKIYEQESGKKFSADQIINLEPRPYQDHYTLGAEAYDKKDYQSLLDHIEKSLLEYIEEEEDCRVMCEGPFDQDGLQPDLYIALANHLTYALKCRRKCPVRLQHFDGFSSSYNLVSQFYYYLSVAYENLKQPEESAKAVASFLLIHPESEDLLKRKKELSEFEDSADWFTPRPEAVLYVQRDKTETKLLEYIEKEFRGYAAEVKAAQDAIMPALKPPSSSASFQSSVVLDGKPSLDSSNEKYERNQESGKDGKIKPSRSAASKDEKAEETDQDQLVDGNSSS